ncbi:CDP-diacylglycerol--glycerol-3-phosphate 3-phosphatidyltransferase [Rhodobacteraceae bacterium N5(2021)]|uniref:CDP-diacylglycerol--glycerol-3-phosphate 3-phosphatidyltransferase n=1 Tax=Gymnodinialimonas phycosphaerae TaxID=2841589 RepID=A0A975YEM9_9RHOB|nr:CDP-diacylglycerol--glycerol-3-phosphate 3-phosphatidyltransferase [Gymnodinialimonas phycosphaerae]MBY4893786.1 CDP-diacylglycerol--glycerol-3-phosphate 3-phosphatidyltransferase [Gymnodinialimonas phycosphaerae]
MQWNVPNILTLVRLIAAPMVGFVFLFLPRPFADWVALFLFMGASMTDYLDGLLARKWGQESRFGAMLDPIADKAMVVIALAVLLVILSLDHGWSALVLIPVIVILFREIFVSGLREFLGAHAGTLQVTKLAKWKTTLQMVAIGLLFCWGLFTHYLWALTIGMDATLFEAILAGDIADEFGLFWIEFGSFWSGIVGLILLWLAAVLTAVTGLDYFMKARPFLQEDP